MKYSMVFAAAAATTVSAGNTGKCSEEGGNFFCSAVKALQYDGLDVAGTYKAVTSMTQDGGCTFADVPFSGPIAPFDEDVSNQPTTTASRLTHIGLTLPLAFYPPAWTCYHTEAGCLHPQSKLEERRPCASLQASRPPAPAQEVPP